MESKSIDQKIPFDRAYWVESGKLLAGAYPGDKRLDTARNKLQSLLDAGIRTIISLMDEHETSWYGEPFEPYEENIKFLAMAAGIDVTCMRFPIRDMNAPSKEELTLILDKIDNSIADGKPVYVHCWGGKGRAGTVVGCWLARHGKATGNDALFMIQELRKNDPTRFEPSPESERQREIVRLWRAGE
jgi:protein-tyrosine phosphatase